MFSIFKSKAYLLDLIPDNHIDLHSHLLPGIDDGSPTVEMSEKLFSEMKKIGFADFICTPHIMTSIWDNTAETISAAHKLMLSSSIIKDQGIKIRYAAEYMMDSSFSEKVKAKEILCLKDNYVLVEMSYTNPPIQLFEIVFELQCAGYKPVLAHPERYNFFHKNMDAYEKLRKAGCLFQMNLLSTVGYYSTSVAECADKLLKKGFIDFCSSDVHHLKHTESFYKRIIIKESEALKQAIENTNQFR